MTYKPSKVVKTDQVFGLWSEFISRSAQCSCRITSLGDDLCHPG